MSKLQPIPHPSGYEHDHAPHDRPDAPTRAGASSCARRVAARSARRPGSPRSSTRYGFDLHANVLRDDSGATCAGIAYAELDDFLGHRIVSVPFCDYLDPVIDDDGAVAPARRSAPRARSAVPAEGARRRGASRRHAVRARRRAGVALHQPRALRRRAARRVQPARPPEHPLRRAQRRDGSVRHRPRRRPAVPRAPPAHAQAQALAARPAGLVLREHLEAVRAHRQRRDRLRRARGRRDRIGVLSRVGRRLVLQVQRVDLRTIGRASEREAGLGEHAARDEPRLRELRLGRQRPRPARASCSTSASSAPRSAG